MKKIFLILIAAIAVAFVSCTDNDAVSDSVTPKNEAPIIDIPGGANRGEIMVKFKPEIANVLDRTLTRAGRSVMTRSGISSMDEVLERIGTYKLERIFPVDKRNEERTRSAGLSLWYVIHFDENTDLEQVAKDLARVAEVAKVQFSHNIKRAYNPNMKPTLLDEKTRRLLTAPRAAERGTASFDDPGLALQWGYINDGEVLKEGDLNSRNETVVPAVIGADVNCKEAWELCKGDPSIIVAVLDEGVMWKHEDLKDNMWQNEGEKFADLEDNDGNGYAGDRYGYNFVLDQGLITYDDANDTGHGSHVAGTIAAVNNNGRGVCSVAGGDGTPNSGVKIMTCQVFAGQYGATLYTEAKAIKYAADNGAVVLQCSWGYNSGRANPSMYSPGFTTDKGWVDGCPLEKEALDYFIHNAGSPNGVIDGGIVVFAGGNEYAAMAGYPGAYPDYISVAAVAADGTPSSYSNFGGGIKISAPGGDSDYHKSPKGQVYSTIPPLAGDLYGYMEGTSMACPHVSGVIALGLSHAAKLHRHFRAADFRQLVVESVNNVESYFTKTKLYWPNYEGFGSGSPMQMEPAFYRNKMGSGMIDAYKLLRAVEGNGVEMTVPNMFVAIGGSSKINYTRYFNNGENMTFTCAVADQTVATLTTTDQINFTLKGLKNGSTKATVTASDGTKKDFYITVRKSNGWM